MSNAVFLAKVDDYLDPALGEITAGLLDDAGLGVRCGDRVLVKPNLVSGSNARACTTHPAVVAATCARLLDLGARVTVADSPGYGPAAKVADGSGLSRALAPLGLTVKTLGHPLPLELSLGGTIGISRQAMETDLILNLPKLKVHGQMVVSGAVKNLFGCVVGFRKAFAHYKRGHSFELFRSMIIDINLALPRTVHLMDGIEALHRAGPINGEPYPLGWLGASASGVALDTAAWDLLGLVPDQVPLWQEARQRHLPGWNPVDLTFPRESPDIFTTTGFTMAEETELSFAPWRLIRGRVRSLLKRLEKS